MAESMIQVATDGSGKQVDTFTSGASSTHRQAIVIADSVTTANVAAVTAQGALQVATGPIPATTGSITTASTTVGPVNNANMNGCSVTVTGTFTGVNFQFLASLDGTTYYPVTAVRSDTSVAETASGVLSTSTRSWDIYLGCADYFKILSTAWASGSAAITISPQIDSAEVAPATIPQGPVAEGVAPTTNPIRVAGWDGTLVRTLKTDTNGNQYSVLMDSAGTNKGTIKAASTLAAATDTALVVSFAGANTATKIGDGTNNAAVKAASTAATAADPAVVVALSPNVGPAITTNAAQACTTKMLAVVGSATNVKASAGNLMGLAVQNQNAAVVWVEFFDAASVTLGTTTPVVAIPLAASATLVIPPGMFALYNHATQIFVAAVTAYNGSSTGSISGTVFYK